MNAPGKPARPRWRRWLRRIGFGLLALVVLLAIFHRPLFFEGTRYFIIRAAKQQHLDLSYEISGSIFTTLSILNLRGIPTEPGPIQRLEIGTLNLRYSLIGLIRDGLPGFLNLVDARNIYVEITPGEPLPPEKEKKPQQFKFPALFPAVLNIENVNFIAHAPQGNTELAGLFLSLLPDRPGILKIQTLDVPGVHRWTEVSAHTTFRDRNLVLTDLKIGSEISLRTFNLDASKLDNAELGLGLEGTLFDAPTTLSAQVFDLNATNRLKATAESSGLLFDRLWKYFNLSVPLQGKLDRLAITFEGEPVKPSSWSGKCEASVSSLAYDHQALGDISLNVDLGGAQAKVKLADRLDQDNRVDLEAHSQLPETFDDFDKISASGRLEIFTPDLVALTLPLDVIGDLAVTTDFQLANAKLSAQTVLDSSSLAFVGAELTKTHFTVHLERDLTTKPDAPVFETLVTRLEGGIQSVRFQDYVSDSLNLVVSSREADVSLERFTLAKGGNTVSLQASYTLPHDLKSWDVQPLDFNLNVDAPELSSFVVPSSGANLQGALRIAGKGGARDKVYNGNFEITGRDIQVQGLPIRTVDGRLEVADNQARLSQLDVVFDDKNSLHGSVNVALADPFEYGGSLDVQLTDLSLFQPLLEQEALAPTLAGSLRVAWKGRGQLSALQHTGDANVELTRGQFGEVKEISVRAAAAYTPQFINVPDIRATAGKFGEATLSLFWKDNRLNLSKLSVRQNKLTLVEGSAELPLHLAETNDPNRLIPNGEPLKLALRTKDLDLRSLFNQLGEKKPPVIGTVNLDVTAEGTLDDLTAKLALRATRIQSPEASQVAPADVSLNLEAAGDRLRLDGVIQQKLIQPLRISGNIPFDIAAIRKNRQIDPQTPIDLRVAMPRSSLDFLSTLVPAIRQSRGTATVDVNVGGTIEQPNLSGQIAADLPTLRFTDPILPPIANAALRVNFTRDRVVIDQCSGRIGGGSFYAAGNISLTRLDQPIFDLRAGSRNALVLQNDDLSVRASSDLQIKGPLNTASITGNIYVTRSRFFKNIDILPIGLPGRPAPQPPPEPTFVSFPDPPLRDWTFDVTIRTADAFLVQSNLATGKITMDLKLGGTGLKPWMDGSVYIEQLTASLPFSRLQIESGVIYFVRDDPFVPRLNLRGTSTIRDYDVTVYITGPVTNPQAIFTSDPPLPQAEIVSLIATGSTTQELSRDPNALAGRAAILLFQKIYRSVFSRNKPPSENESFFSRVGFEFGTVDPKTGKQAASLALPLSDRLVLVGGLDVGGNFRGQINYLVRFK